jgi:hypothetical protein
MHILKYRIFYTLSIALFLFLFIIKCGPLPTDPYNDYSNAQIELLPINVPAQGFKIGDTVTYSIVIKMPHLFSSITVTANDMVIQEKIETSKREKDTCLIRQYFNEPDTFYVTINAILKNDEKRSTNAKVIINGIPPIITKDLKPLNYVKTGAACTLSVAVSGSTPQQFLWYHDSTNVFEGKNDKFIIPAFSNVDAGVYFCIATNSWGADTSASAVLISGDTIKESATWIVDTLRDSLFEGDSISKSLKGLYTRQATQSVTVSLAGQSNKAVSVNDSLFKFTAGHRDSGDYVFSLVLSDSKNNDILPILIKVKPRYYSIFIAADSGTVTLSPQLSQYRWNDTVQLKAIPKTGFVFYQWDGDFSGTNENMTLVITKTISGIARFWSIKNSECDKVSDKNLANAIKMYSTSSNRPKKFCPDPGEYNNGALKINGGVRFVLQK